MLRTCWLEPTPERIDLAIGTRIPMPENQSPGSTIGHPRRRLNAKHIEFSANPAVQ